MENTPALKRQNFNVTPEEEAQLQSLREALNAPSIKDAVLRAARILLTLNQETREGRRIYTIDRDGTQSRLLLPDIETPAPGWKYLAPRPESWKQQLFVKGRRLTAANVWFDMWANEQTPQEAAENWNLPLEAIEEIIRYCEANEDVIGREADQEKRSLIAHGVELTPKKPRMRLLIDEDSINYFLIKRLREAGHDVLTVSEAGLASSPDAIVFALARSERRVLLTRNTDDFLTLHDAEADHAGILAEYQDQN